MCGISGVISADVNQWGDLTECAMLQQHRGPDHFGQNQGQHHLLNHNRLSILDTGENSHQPIVDDNYAFVYNGEVYNYRELYTNYGDHPPASDTLGLFQMLKQDKQKILPTLNGMFALALFDKKNRTLLLSRDRTGIKPLYYSYHNGVFCFASELKSLNALIEKIHGVTAKSALNRSCVDDFFVLGHSEFGTMPHQHIVELKPGSSLSFDLDNASITTQNYFNLTDNIQKSKVDKLAKHTALVDQLDELLHNSIKAHLLSDVQIGTLCSGGIDSSLITAIAVQYNKNLAIYHAGIKGGGGEEEYAADVAKHLGIDIRYIYMDPDSYLSQFANITYYNDFPIYHPSDVSLFQVAHKAKKDGTKVLLCGEGADELFGGYRWHTRFKLTRDRYKIASKFASAFHMFLKWFHLHKQADTFSAEQYLAYTPSYLNYLDDAHGFFSKRGALIRNPQSWNYFERLLSAYQQAGIDDPGTASFISNNLEGHLRSLLHRNDRMCMMASVEARVPFIENSLINFALNLPTGQKINGKEAKYLLKKVAERYIPHKNVYRSKAGFPVPWMSATEKIDTSIFEDGFITTYLDLSNNALKLWMGKDRELLMLACGIEVWGRIHVLQESTETVSHALMKDKTAHQRVDTHHARGVYG